MNTLHELISKYDAPTPRYTSYPTVPYWDTRSFSEVAWRAEVRNTFENDREISLYVHLPFCENLCTYCACNKRITKNHQVESPYIETLLKEWQMYKEIFGKKPIIKELHLGGGTPTFFSWQNLERLISGLLEGTEIPEHREFSVEVHPNTTDAQQLQSLFDAGFRRISVGVQDFDRTVQYIINRHQTFEQTQYIIDTARQIGYTSVNVDIIYGLPLQTQESINLTMKHLKELRPERIAFYSYAHVPWKSASQRRYTEEDLPQGNEKRALYELGRKLLTDDGYQEIGMDHFALEGDALLVASQSGTLHRNFMGYTTQNTALLIGLGASSISDTGGAFAQNMKEVEEYQQVIQEGRLALSKGHLLSCQDLILRKHILNLMCMGATHWQSRFLYTPSLQDALLRLAPLEADGLVVLTEKSISVTPLGKAFLRNICACLDERLHTKNNKIQFSRSA